jgi:hypothetical protein
MIKTRLGFFRQSIILVSLFMLAGCAAAPVKFNPDAVGPQLIVNRSNIRLGVVKLVKDTKIVFQGKGFDPGDSVFVNIIGVKKDGELTDIPIAEAIIDQDGNFTAEVSKIVKIIELLLADVGLNDEMQNYVLITRPPIPPGNYVIRAESMESEKKAECRLEIKGPSIGDSLKDWIGGLLGKIKKE